jgi:plasmid stability protein
MSRFYFHLRDGDQFVTDDEGTDLPDLFAARREAVLCAREILAEAIKSGKRRVPEFLVIADEAGRELGTSAIADALPEQFRK